MGSALEVQKAKCVLIWICCTKPHQHWPVMTTFKIWPQDWPYIIPTKIGQNRKEEFEKICFAYVAILRNVQQKWSCPMSENPALFRERDCDCIAIASIIAPARGVHVQFLVWKNCVLFCMYHINFKALSMIVWLKLMFVVYLVISHAYIYQSWPPSRYGVSIDPTPYRPNFIKIYAAVQEI